MTTFKQIRGNLIKSTSTDPANPQEGQIWYNSTSQVLKGEELLELGQCLVIQLVGTNSSLGSRWRSFTRYSYFYYRRI
jgi:hypothetical protein